MEHLNEDAITKLGFRINRTNPHIYDTEAFGDFFNILKYKNEESYIVDFGSYYDECRFEGFKYVSEIELLISILKDKPRQEGQ